MNKSLRISFIAVLLFLFCSGCTNCNDVVPTISSDGLASSEEKGKDGNITETEVSPLPEQNEEEQLSTLPNPASKKCLEDGYSLEVINSPETGVPIYSLLCQS